MSNDRTLQYREGMNAADAETALDKDVETFLTIDDMTLNDVVEGYLQAGVTRETVGIIIPRFQRALEAEREASAQLAAAHHFTTNSVPFPKCPFPDVGERVVSAASIVKQKEK